MSNVTEIYQYYTSFSMMVHVVCDFLDEHANIFCFNFSYKFILFLDLRKPYYNKEEPFLLEENLPSKNPFEIFDVWFRNVAENKNLTLEEVNAVCLSTVSIFRSFVSNS